MNVVHIGLGSNLGDREERILRAVHELRSFSRVRKISALVETRPVGVREQPKFLNAAVEIETDFTPREVLEELLRIEEEMGRKRSGAKGEPRVIDLDILTCGDRVVEEEGLRVPHPRLHERRFALAPLAELAPDWTHPVLNMRAEDLLKRLPPDAD